VFGGVGGVCGWGVGGGGAGDFESKGHLDFCDEKVRKNHCNKVK